MALSYHNEPDYFIHRCIESIFPRDLACGAKYLGEEMKIGG
jgi:hypothetical protein